MVASRLAARVGGGGCGLRQGHRGAMAMGLDRRARCRRGRALCKPNRPPGHNPHPRGSPLRCCEPIPPSRQPGATCGIRTGSTSRRLLANRGDPSHGSHTTRQGRSGKARKIANCADDEHRHWTARRRTDRRGPTALNSGLCRAVQGSSPSSPKRPRGGAFHEPARPRAGEAAPFQLVPTVRIVTFPAGAHRPYVSLWRWCI